MGEIPKSITLKFDDGDVILIIYTCQRCELWFGVGKDLQEEEPLCPECGQRDEVSLALEYT